MNLVRYFFSTYPRHSAITTASLVVAALAEGLGLVTFVPLLTLFLDGEGAGAASSAVGQAYSDALARGLVAIGLPFTLLTVGVVIALLLFVKSGVMLLTMRQVGNTVAWVATDLRLQVLDRLLRARWSFFTHHPLGRLANSVATEANRSAEAYRQIVLAGKYTLLSLVGLAVAVWINWQLALVTIAGWSVVGFGLNSLVKLAKRAGAKQTTVINELLGRLTDVLLNLKVLKAMRREDRVAPMLGRDTDRLQKALRKQVLAQEALNALQEPLMFLIVLVTLVVARSGAVMQVEELSVMVFALIRALAGATKIQRRIQLAQTNAPALESLLELLASAEAEAEQLPTGPEPTLERAITLHGVSFAHPDHSVLDGVDIEIPAGEITALIGGSGGGKTTVTDLVVGLRTPDAGEVAIDGIPLGDLDVAAWRGRIGYVPQELVLHNDSIRANVTFGDPAIRDADIEEALRAAGVWQVVSELPGGLDAPVGERGSALSGGQRARISIARALVVRPLLLIFDEATAALDPDTERVVLETLSRLRGRVTVLAISHQPALCEVADRVYRVEGGGARLLTRSELIAS